MLRSMWKAACAMGVAAVMCGQGVAQQAVEPIPNGAAWQPKGGETLAFDVFRNGDRFGTHVVTFSRTGDALTVDSDIELKVTFGPLTAYHYVHDATEVWVAGRLDSVRARTKNEGKWRELVADAAEGGLNVIGSAFKGLKRGIVIPSTHWNVAEMKQAAMFSTETGAMLPMTVIDQGVETVKVGSGSVDARRYLVKSELEATFWYDASGRWVKCAFEAKGSKVEYILRELPA